MYVICMQELYVIVEKNYSWVQILHFCKKKGHDLQSFCVEEIQ